MFAEKAQRIELAAFKLSAFERAHDAESDDKVWGRSDKLGGKGSHPIVAAEFLAQRIARDFFLREQLCLAAHAIGQFAAVNARDAAVVAVPFAIIVGSSFQGILRQDDADVVSRIRVSE